MIRDFFVNYAHNVGATDIRFTRVGGRIEHSEKYRVKVSFKCWGKDYVYYYDDPQTEDVEKMHLEALYAGIKEIMDGMDLDLANFVIETKRGKISRELFPKFGDTRIITVNYVFPRLRNWRLVMSEEIRQIYFDEWRDA